MSTYKFDKYNDLIHLLFEAKLPNNEYSYAFDDWEVTYLSLDAPLGLELSLNTKTTDASTDNEYQQWKKVKNIVRAFLTQDVPTQFSNVGWYDRIPFMISGLDIRLKCPKAVKDLIDANSQFDSFRLSLIVDHGLVMATVTAVERALPAEAEVILLWNSYVDEIVRKWKNDNAK